MTNFMGKCVQWWVEFFMPLIVKAAMPLRALGGDKYEDAVGDGILMIVEAVSGGNTTFDPTKGNIVDWATKALAGVRMEAREEAQAGTTSLDALIEANEGDDESFLSLSAYEGNDYVDVDADHELFDLLNSFRHNTVELIGEPSAEDIAGGDTENDRWLFSVPAPDPARKYLSRQVVFGQDKKPIKTREVEARVDGSGAAYYPDDDLEEVSLNGLLMARYGELDDDRFREDSMSEDNWLGLVEELTEEPVEDENEDAPDPVPALNTAPRRFWQLQREMREFEFVADGIRHLAYVDWRDIKPVTVRALTPKGHKTPGFIAQNGALIPLTTAQGFACRVQPASGNVEAMLAAVQRNFGAMPAAKTFLRRVEAVKRLQ